MADSKLALGISGSPSPTSSSRRLIEVTLAVLEEKGWTTDLIDLATLDANALLVRGEHASVTDAIERIGEARILVIGTPVYRATYTGLLKTLFDLMPMDHLAGHVAILIATGAAPGHMLAVDHGLRPLIASLNGLSASTGIYAIPADFDGEQPGGVLTERLMAAAEEANGLAS